MTSPVGYNNPAYTHQYDSSLYDYQYVPEIDPEYDGQHTNSQEQIHLVHPNLQQECSGDSEEFDASDESNQSIIVQEYNNRRVTLICEKRKPDEKFYEDRNCRGAYHHNISLESENDFRESQDTVSHSRHNQRLEPPVESNGNAYNQRNRNQVFSQTMCQRNQIQQRQHRYEEIDDYDDLNRNRQVSRHRYAEITVDENGYPSLGNQIEVEHHDQGYRILNADQQQKPKQIQKSRAASPINQSFSPTFSPSKTYQRTISPKPPNIETIPQTAHSRHLPPNGIEMADLSPPLVSRQNPNQISFFQSPKRQPPIGASSPTNLHEQIKTTARKNCHKRQNSMVNESKRTPNARTSVTHAFQVKTTPKTSASKEKTSSRRNISYSFTDPPRLGSPYRPTTTEIPKAKTAIITPIFQRKNKSQNTGNEDELGNFRKMSHIFQSTGNLYGCGMPDHQPQISNENKVRIKRNQSVPNFAQSLANEGKFKQTRGDEYLSQKAARKLEYQYSPAKSDRFSPIDRSRLSLIDQTKRSWSTSESDFQSHSSGCLIVGAVIQIVTSVASCAICFYLFSKLGRRYYLDFGILAGFVNLVLGVLGFRSQCWRWLPNRNYVSGYILLTAFSIITCAGFVYLITARPMSGDPILDLMGGGICGVSVLTIILSLTGLTMSGCCKSPPPDNRVNNI